MKHLVVGILAHVDAGKTTLSEALLYLAGSIRSLGRVDRGSAFLDTYQQERERGITIFSKQARLQGKEAEITLIDTPGHVDFSAEMERTLQVLDAAVLVISGSDGVQGHTRTLWRLLKRYGIPVFLFINKMDQPVTDRQALFASLRKELSGSCVDFSGMDSSQGMPWEELAMCGDEKLLEDFLETGSLKSEDVQSMVRERRVFPCFFGSALRLQGVETLLSGIPALLPEPVYPEGFGARVFKITRDEAGNRLTHMKITGGILKAREMLSGTVIGIETGDAVSWKEKVNQIRVYSGDKFEIVPQIEAGRICTVTGLSSTWAGEGLGYEREITAPLLEPVLSYRVLLPEGCDAVVMLQKLRQLEEEEPQLHVLWEEQNREIKMQLMGQVQTEVLERLIQERFGVLVQFGAGSIVYKETIADTVEGVGHYEPLRHYAEVHLLLQPGERGSGLQFSSDCREDELDLNWQRLVLTHLEEKEHRGVLTGAPITDMKITLKAGKAHLKHTEGGDFRQATYRALRQGLMQAQSILLEPYYEFRLELPETALGRAMTDIEQMKGSFELEENTGGIAVLRGMVPIRKMQDYQREVASYTGGRGRLSCLPAGYYPCQDAQAIIEQFGYDPERDLEDPSASVFCAHGAGFLVAWDKVSAYMHLPSVLDGKPHSGKTISEREAGSRQGEEKQWLGTEEVDEIIRKTSHANSRQNQSIAGHFKRERRQAPSAKEEKQTKVYKPQPVKEEYLLVDGYNVIFAWEELKEIARVSLDGARGRLLDILCNYQAIRGCRLIAVFDAYRVAGHPTEIMDYHNIHVVYTKEAETADQYIEKFAHENSRRYDVTVATSDGLEQIIIVGEGCHLLSARELEQEVKALGEELMENYQTQRRGEEKLGNSLSSALPTFPEQVDQV